MQCATDPSLALSIPSFAESHREYCLQWKPRESFLTITDSKKRDWLVHDVSSFCTPIYPFPFGSRASNRIFWRDDHVRAVHLLSDADRVTALDAVRRQLRGTMRIDFDMPPLS